MSATPKQIKLIEDLLDVGAPYPPNPLTGEGMSEHMFDSVQEADVFIKQHYHLLRHKAVQEKCQRDISNRIRPDEWGGIPNH